LEEAIMSSTEKSDACTRAGQDVQQPAMPSWQTAPCPPWCAWNPHSEDEIPEDRSHASATSKRTLPLERPAEVEKGKYEPEYVGIYLWQHVREVEPTVTMCKGEGNEGFRLTLDDAEVVAELLRSLAAEARNAGAQLAQASEVESDASANLANLANLAPASASCPDGGRFVVPRKVERGHEHPHWCEVRRYCTVDEVAGFGGSGWHHDEPERLRGEDDDRLEFELSASAFHDTDGKIDRPSVAVRVVETGLVDSFVDGSLTAPEARALAALLVKMADHTDALGRGYA
jgi:hypothetical protein